MIESRTREAPVRSFVPQWFLKVPVARTSGVLRSGRFRALPLISTFLLAGYLSLNLMAAFCMVEGPPSAHHHQAPLHHRHTPLCGWAHAVGSLVVTIAAVALVVFFPKAKYSFRLYAQTTRFLPGSSLFGRAPPSVLLRGIF